MFDASSVPELIRRTASDPLIAPRVALETQGERVTYAELAQRIERVAGALLERRMPRGARVALLGGRNVNTVAALFGIQAAGGAVCVLDPHDTARIGARLEAAAITWLVFEDVLDAQARALGSKNAVRIEDTAGASCNSLTDLEQNEDALLLFTSGSTGAAKAVRLSHGNLLANAFGVAERTGVSPEDRLLHAMPLHHTNGINNQLIVPFACGASVVLIDRFRAESFFGAVEAWRPSYITGVPTMYLRLLAYEPPRQAMRALRFARCGSAAISADEQRAIEQQLGVPLLLSYGLSEATCTSTMNPPDARRIGSVGPALAAQKIAILTPGCLQPVAQGEEGEVCIAGPAVMQGYVGGDAAGGPVISNGWLRTGDLGRVDSGGYLTITGRLKDLIIRGGENLSPGAIEAALLAHPQVKSCCVIGVPDADLGEVPFAFVVASDPAAPPDADALRSAVRERLSPVHVPREVMYLEALPENAVGKIDRQALRALAAPGPRVGAG